MSNEPPSLNAIPVFAPLAPLVTIDLYAKITGVSIETVRMWVQRGYVPTHKIGKRLLVNVALLQKNAAMASWQGH